MTANTMTVACAADARYALPLAVMLNSLGSNLAADCVVEAYVIDDGIPLEDKRRIAASLDSRVLLHWEPAMPLPAGLPTWRRMAATTYQKLVMGDWLPDSVHRVLWLDGDMLVVGDVSRLYQESLGGKIALAAQDQRVLYVSSRFGVTVHRELGIASDAKYFNAGVMLIDVDRWRKENVGRRSLEYLQKYGEKVYFWDQEALNAVLAGEWEELDLRWNWHPGLDRLLLPVPARQHSEVGQGGLDPWIVHFSGSLKPWMHFGAGPYWHLYQRYLDQTAWSGSRPARHWRSRFMAWYEMSRLRRLLYPAERWGTVIMRDVTADYHQPK